MYHMAAELRAGRGSFFVSSKPGPRVRRSKAWEKGMGELFSLDAIEKETMLTYLVGRPRAARKQPSAATAAHVHEQAGGVRTFRCQCCGLAGPADLIAAANIAFLGSCDLGRGEVTRPDAAPSQHCDRDPAHPTRYPGLMSEGSACRATCKLGRFARADRHLGWPTVAPT